MENKSGLSGLVIRFYDKIASCSIEAQADGEWTEIWRSSGHLSDWVALPDGTVKARLVNQSKGRVNIAEINLYGAGERPREAPAWEDAEKADILMITAHPDDELLWFGGLLPTYAGERKLTVQVFCMVPATPLRRLEFLDGLWHCGVTAYPSFGTLRDARSKSLAGQYRLWGKNTVYRQVTEEIRRIRPEVIITHDIRGEYGHGAHRAAADAAINCLRLASDQSRFPESARQYGVWSAKKLYVHLYPERQVRMDWHIPLAAFDGKDGMTVAKEALAYHVSQVRHGWAIEEGGNKDNSLFGLYWSSVGEDTDARDLMEHTSAQPDEMV